MFNLKPWIYVKPLNDGTKGYRLTCKAGTVNPSGGQVFDIAWRVVQGVPMPYTTQTSRNSRTLEGLKMTNKDTSRILVDVWQAKFDMIPVDVELIESKTSKKVKVFVDGKLYKIYPSINSFNKELLG